MAEPTRSHLRDVRVGRVTLQEVLTECEELEAQLQSFIDISPLPAEPNKEAVEAWMLDTYWEYWRAHRPGGGGTPPGPHAPSASSA
jgi:hypothetical protein